MKTMVRNAINCGGQTEKTAFAAFFTFFFLPSQIKKQLRELPASIMCGGEEQNTCQYSELSELSARDKLWHPKAV